MEAVEIAEVMVIVIAAIALVAGKRIAELMYGTAQNGKESKFIGVKE